MTDDRLRRATLAYQEVIRALDLQERALDSMRVQSGVAISAALVLASIAAATGKVHGWWPWFPALVVMAVAVGAAFWAGRPAKVWATFSGYHLVQEHVDPDDQTAEDMYRDLTLYGQAGRDENEKMLRCRRVFYMVGVGALAFEALFVGIGLLT